MPKLITRQTDSLQKQDQPCNFEDLSQNIFEEQEITIEELKKRCARYRELLASLQPSQEQTMIQASNFTTESVLQLIQRSPGSAFIRVYYGIEENGEHRLFMAPVSEAGNLVTEDSSIYVDDCCHCPPRLNCPADELLEVQP